MSTWKEWPEVQGAVVLDGLDEAVIGVTIDQPAKLIYSTVMIERVLRRRDGMSHEEAAEFAWFNIYTAVFGARSPVFATLSEEG
jgi:hypothetical protein